MLALRKDRLRELMEQQAGGSYRRFARELNVNPGYLHRFLNSDRRAGPRLLGAVKRYCEERGLKFENYIFLDEPLHAVNDR